MSGLNCKPGDLAIIFKSLYGNEGKIVTCVRLIGKRDFRHIGIDYTWEIDPPVERMNLPAGHPWLKECPDSFLRPIRPQSDDAVDEMVKLVGIAPMTAAEVLAWSAA